MWAALAAVFIYCSHWFFPLARLVGRGATRSTAVLPSPKPIMSNTLKHTRWVRARLVALLLLAVASANPPTFAASLNSLVDFSDFAGNPSAESWSIGSTAGGPVSNAGRFGVGDHAVRYVPSIARPGFHFLHVAQGGTPNADMLGNYTAAGVTAIQADIRILSGDILTLRAYLFADPLSGPGAGPHAVSSESVVLDSINDSAWTTYTFPIREEDLIAIRGSRSDLLTRVSRIGLRHDPAGTGAGTPVPLVSGANVLFDNVVLRRLLPGDFNADGVVDLRDYTLWRDNVGGPEAVALGGNGNNNGIVDVLDYEIWRTSFGDVSAAIGQSNLIPEPATGLLCLFGIGIVRARYRYTSGC